MKAVEFCFWLQGFFEMANPQELSARETELIKQHLGMVFKHEIDPSHGSSEHQSELQSIHDGKKPNVGLNGETYRC